MSTRVPQGSEADATGHDGVDEDVALVNRRRQSYRGGSGELVIVIDCSELARSARFWTEVLGYVDTGGGSTTYQTLLPADGQGVEVLLQRALDDKHHKNRVHLDLRTRDLDSEVARVREVGARLVTATPIVEAGWRWHVLADPDGNEFCVIEPPADYWTGDETKEPSAPTSERSATARDTRGG
jgi:predicted enzyme related to lactoylglutathione lyase